MVPGWRRWRVVSARRAERLGRAVGDHRRPAQLADPYLVRDAGGACASPEVSGWPRLTSDICGEYARKLSGVQAFLLVTALSPMDCKSIAKASKVRILHLPPSA